MRFDLHVNRDAVGHDPRFRRGTMVRVGLGIGDNRIFVVARFALVR